MSSYENSGNLSFPEEGDDANGFMEGYSKEEEIEECSECGSALNEDNKVAKEIEGENYLFCSDLCVEEFEESI